MQLPIYQSEEEQRLMVELWSPALADDPEAFVLFAFPWGQKNTPLHKFKGPRKWQREVLRDIKAHIEATKARSRWTRCERRCHLAEGLASQP
jgi:hypothetical protein